MVKNYYDYYAGKRVFVTGHTGFKGSWLCEWLLHLGAKVYGFALRPPTDPSLFVQLGLEDRLAGHVIGDIRDLDVLRGVIAETQPEFVFHLAAQPLVRLSYEKPVETFDTNVMGTIHLLEACRSITGQVSVVCVTTDKCYENKETLRPYKEDDPMGGFDPYSCSKGCDELVISSYRRSFFGTPESNVWVASARAGNVIGGGDWAMDRIVPDSIRALAKGAPISVRNQFSIRPWQHVLEPLSGYLTLGMMLGKRTCFSEIAGGFNFGPDPHSNRTVRDLVGEVLKHWPGKWVEETDKNAVHEAGLLSLDITKAYEILGWRPTWSFEDTVKYTIEWYAAVLHGEDPVTVTQQQLMAFSV